MIDIICALCGKNQQVKLLYPATFKKIQISEKTYSARRLQDIIHVYNIFIPAQGTVLEEIRINNFQLPINLTIQEASIRSLTFKEIDEIGYITMPTGSTN